MMNFFFIELYYDRFYYNFDFKMDYFKKIKKLYLYRLRDTFYFFEILNQHFDHLEVLYLKDEKYIQFFYHGYNKSVFINLEKLKILFIENHFEKLELKTPNLEKLIYMNWGEIWFRGRCERTSHFLVDFCYEPEKLKYIKCEFFNFTNLKMKNLETLICKIANYSFNLINYPKLKRLELCPTESELHFVENVRAQKNKLNRLDLELMVSGFKDKEFDFTFTRKLISFLDFSKMIYFIEENKSEKLIENYLKLSTEIPWSFSINYSNFIEQQQFKIKSENFLKIFKNIKLIIVDKQVNELNFLNFLKATNVEYLKLYCELSQKDFYDQLNTVKSINKLKIHDFNNSIDYSFLLSLKFIECVRLKAPKLPIDIIYQLFMNKDLSFHYFNFKRSDLTTCLIRLSDKNLGCHRRSFTRSLFYDLALYNTSKYPVNTKKSSKDLNELISFIKFSEEFSKILI